MKAFDFNRFLNVARWDLSVNSKFYTRSALLMVAIICMPIVVYYLYNMLTNGFFFSAETYDNIHFFVVADVLLGIFYSIISSGYIFHNLLTKQGRINELTLPATNLERFLWHVVVIVIGVQWFGSSVFCVPICCMLSSVWLFLMRKSSRLLANHVSTTLIFIISPRLVIILLG